MLVSLKLVLKVQINELCWLEMALPMPAVSRALFTM